MAKKKTTDFQDNLAKYSELVQLRAIYKDMLIRLQNEFLEGDTQKSVKQMQAVDGEFNISVTQEALGSAAVELEKRIEELTKVIEELG